MNGRPASGGPSAWRVAAPWVYLCAGTSILSLIERLVTPETRALDGLVDGLLSWGLLLGIVVATWMSAERARDEARPPASVGWGAVILLAFLGSLMAAGILTLVAHDVDGASWVVFSPLLGLVVAVGLRVVRGRRG